MLGCFWWKKYSSIWIITIQVIEVLSWISCCFERYITNFGTTLIKSAHMTDIPVLDPSRGWIQGCTLTLLEAWEPFVCIQLVSSHPLRSNHTCWLSNSETSSALYLPNLASISVEELICYPSPSSVIPETLRDSNELFTYYFNLGSFREWFSTNDVPWGTRGHLWFSE